MSSFYSYASVDKEGIAAYMDCRAFHNKGREPPMRDKPYVVHHFIEKWPGGSRDFFFETAGKAISKHEELQKDFPKDRIKLIELPTNTVLADTHPKDGSKRR